MLVFLKGPNSKLEKAKKAIDLAYSKIRKNSNKSVIYVFTESDEDSLKRASELIRIFPKLVLFPSFSDETVIHEDIKFNSKDWLVFDTPRQPKKYISMVSREQIHYDGPDFDPYQLDELRDLTAFKHVNAIIIGENHTPFSHINAMADEAFYNANQSETINYLNAYADEVVQLKDVCCQCNKLNATSQIRLNEEIKPLCNECRFTLI